jgi:mono/diheme cytochrome c family protein
MESHAPQHRASICAADYIPDPMRMYALCVGGERMRIPVVATMLLITSCSTPGSAQDGAALYQSKCVACHGPTGSGRTALKGTNLLTDSVRNASDAGLTEAIARGGPQKLASHAYETKGVKPEEIQALVKYVRTLQSKIKP